MHADDELERLLRRAGSVFAEAELAELARAAADGAELGALVDRRVAGEPIEHIVGSAAFAELRVVVRPGVFEPLRALAPAVAAHLAPGGRVAVEVAERQSGAAAAVLRAAGLADVREHRDDALGATVLEAR